MQKITPFLWFDNNVEEAMEFYTSVFKDSEILSVTRWGEGGPGVPGSVLSASFRLNGIEFAALNGGPQFQFTEAVSFVINCKNQEEIDHYWYKLSGNGGLEQPCGWLKDQFGLSWQVVPPVLTEMLQDKDAQKAQNVMNAMMQMTKIEIDKLEEAYSKTA